MEGKNAILQYVEHKLNGRKIRKYAGKFIKDLNNVIHKPDFSVTEEGKLKFTPILLNLAMASFCPVSFCFICFGSMLLDTYKSRIVTSFWWINLYIIIKCLFY